MRAQIRTSRHCSADGSDGAVLQLTALFLCILCIVHLPSVCSRLSALQLTTEWRKVCTKQAVQKGTKANQPGTNFGGSKDPAKLLTLAPGAAACCCMRHG